MTHQAAIPRSHFGLLRQGWGAGGLASFAVILSLGCSGNGEGKDHQGTAGTADSAGSPNASGGSTTSFGGHDTSGGLSGSASGGTSDRLDAGAGGGLISG